MSSASSPIGRSQPITSPVLSSHLWYTHPPSDDEFDIQCSAIPPGKKDNTYFVLDNSLNVRSRKAGGINDFTDDCGVWNRKSTLTKRTDFIIVNNKLSCMKMNQGRYCNIVKGHLVLLDPQPAVEEIVIMKRFYSTLKRDSKFKKRVTWFKKQAVHLWKKISLVLKLK